MAKLEKQSDKKGMYLFWCPGCKCPFHKYSKFLDKDYCTNFKLK